MVDKLNRGIPDGGRTKRITAPSKRRSTEPTREQPKQFKRPNGSDGEAPTLTVQEHLAGLWKVLGLTV